MAKLRHIAITVPDPEKAAGFYVKAFGLRRVGSTDWEGAHGVYLTDGVMNLALLNDPEGIAFDITANGWTGAAKD